MYKHTVTVNEDLPHNYIILFVMHVQFQSYIVLLAEQAWMMNAHLNFQLCTFQYSTMFFQIPELLYNSRMCYCWGQKRCYNPQWWWHW